MKLCKKCGTEKPFDFFHKGKGSDGYKAHCKACAKLYKDVWYIENKQRLRSLATAKKNQYRQLAYDFICEYLLEHPCVDCGENDILVLEFDHRSNKEFGIAQLIQSHSSPVLSEKLIQEVAKCDVRCANCHQRRHAIESNNYRTAYKKENPKG